LGGFQTRKMGLLNLSVVGKHPLGPSLLYSKAAHLLSDSETDGGSGYAANFPVAILQAWR
jgi:hypothetical protein